MKSLDKDFRFQGLYYNNIRWGPGVEDHADVHQNVGLWRGSQLVRLAWRPDTPRLIPAWSTQGRAIVEPHRVILTSNQKIVSYDMMLNVFLQSSIPPNL